MSNLDAEYELFKKLCSLRSIKQTQKNNQLLKNIEKKGLKIVQNNEIYVIQNEVIPLSEESIRANLDCTVNNLIQLLDVLYQADSTNKQIIKNELTENYSVLMTEFQSSGQGRREKKWMSPIADNIYLSIQFQLENSKNVQLIPLITAIAICKSLKKFNANGCKIKWPNDIYLDGKKLAGILVESRFNREQGYTFVVGIGLNVNMQINNNIDQLWTSLCKSQNKFFDRNIITSAILSECIQSYNKILRLDFIEFMSDWKLYDYLNGSEINITNDKASYSAIARGISADGALLIERSGDEILQKIYSADVSVKRKN
ncbi:MAG: biotin--[acetyl-CoA-carboxylase] ligase [Gammaproteobacteria bacterium]|nr:biotin--[acetyl-CoA-carboxylase] ligase [Gammaproteobacteria bacterium]